MPTRPRLSVTHTLALMELSPFAYEEIKRKLLEADYSHVIDDDGTIDMSGIGATMGDKPKISGVNFITSEKKGGQFVVSIAFFKAEDASAFHGWAGAVSAEQDGEDAPRMSGEQLYARYIEAHSERNIGVEEWVDLSDDDQQIWDRIAQLAAGAQP